MTPTLSEHTMAVSPQRHLELLSSLEGWHKFKPSWQPPIFILQHQTPVQPVQPKGFILKGILLPSKSSQLGTFWQSSLQAGHEGWETLQFAKHFGSESSEELQPCSLTTPNAKPFLWGKVSPASPRNPGCLPWHYWHTNSCVWPSSIQQLSICSSSTPQFTGAFFLVLFRFRKEKKQADEFRAVSISLLWEFVVSDMWREITLDNKGYDIFSLLFRTERCAWVRGCNRESKRVSACVGLYVIAILSCFSFKFPYAFPSF